jgi:prephenate dehydrogenase
MFTSTEQQVFAMTFPDNRRSALIVGLGLIGGSLAMALRECGWEVAGSDIKPAVLEEAVNHGVVRAAEPGARYDLIVLAAPSAAIPDLAKSFVEQLNDQGLVTDVAGVKASIAASLNDPRFLPGHPMAGSEQRGLAGARADLFHGCTWVLTPSEVTPPESYATLHSWLRELGANVIALNAADHDRLVAVASHVPHLVAGALMNEAATLARSDGALLQLAAGGFRDMTRISAGDPAIWPDVLFQNREAVIRGLEGVQKRLADFITLLENRDRDVLVSTLTAAALARRQLPGRIVEVDSLVSLRIPVADRPGVLAQVTTLASELRINIFDIEIAHSVEGQAGILLLSVQESDVLTLVGALEERGHRVSWGPLG